MANSAKKPAKKPNDKDQNKQEFQAEVSRLLDIVAHSLYSNRDVFLRELISNASDACDKLRYKASSEAGLLKEERIYGITVRVDKDAKKIIVSDNGIGMDEQDLIDNLGTIARSGTAKFLESAKEKNVDLIGQFGVGFYASFMAADTVEVITKKAGTDMAYSWVSDGKTGFEITESLRDDFGTDVILHVKEDAEEFLNPLHLTKIILTYSDHIDVPINLVHKDEKGEEKQEIINQGSALWTRSKNEITDEQYQQFYSHIGAAAAGGFDIPLQTMHWRAEGTIEYTGLLFLPSMRPWNLFDPQRKHGVRLYVRRVFITDECENLVPAWLRFLKGVIDSQDLPLNISREMLQTNPMVNKIRKGIISKALSTIKALKKEPQDFDNFWRNFGPVLKEGLYEVGDHRDKILDLCIFHSSRRDEQISLQDYVDGMKDGQKEIYYMTGDDYAALKNSPQMEAFIKNDVEVLLMTDTIDGFWVSVVGEYKGHNFASITKGEIDLENMAQDKAGDNAEDNTEDNTADKKEHEEKADAIPEMVTRLKDALDNHVKDVRASKRLVNSLSCLVADAGDADLSVEKIIQQNQDGASQSKRILEVNLEHDVLKVLTDASDDLFKDYAWTVFEQARLLDGQPPKDMTRFIRILNDLTIKAIKPYNT